MCNASFYISSRRTSDKWHHNKLLGEEEHAAARQKESKLGDIASIDFQERLFLT